MIRNRLHNHLIKTVSYDKDTKTMVVELTQGNVVKYSPVPYELYSTLANSRFPEKVYRHRVMNVMPVITGESE